MAKNKGHWDFECPQFVDFVSGLDESSSEDVFFDANAHISPELTKVKNHAAHDMSVKENILTEDAENELMNRMEAALSIIECTPKLPAKKHYSEKAAAHYPGTQMTKTALKRKTVQVPATQLHRSKSVAILNKIINKENKPKGLRKRSSSLGDLKTNKKHTYPLTPMCLKRTIFKAKPKVKTTEEMELEEIAKLQKQLIEHLRFNEISLRKLRLKPRDHTLNQKNIQDKMEKAKEHQVGGKGFNVFADKPSNPPKEPRRNIQKLGHDAVKKEALRLNGIVNSRAHAVNVIEKSTKDNPAIKFKNPSTASSYFSETNDKERPIRKKADTVKKYGFHSGIVFHDNVKKHIVVKPFSFDIKNKEMKLQNSEPEKKVEAWLSGSKLRFKGNEGKENLIHNIHSQTDGEKTKVVETVKFDIKLAVSSKITEKRIENQIRGLPLSENILRKN